MKKNTKKGLGFLALLLMVGLVASFTPGLISALEGETATPPTLVESAAEEPAEAEDIRICPATGEPCDEDCAGPGAMADGTFKGRMGGGNMDGTFNGPGEGTGDGQRTRQRLQDGTAAGGQQRARARDGSNCLTEVVPAG